MTTNEYFTRDKILGALTNCPNCLEGKRNPSVNDYELRKEGILTRRDYIEWLLFQQFIDIYMDFCISESWSGNYREKYKRLSEALKTNRYTVEVLDGREEDLKNFDVVLGAYDDDTDYVILRPERLSGLKKPPEYYIDYLLKNWKQLYKRWLPLYLKKAEFIAETPLFGV